MRKKRYLVLEDGSFFQGFAFGGDNFRIGRIVFNTSMTGYQRILCDSSYSGQIINFTYPLIGNAGINRDGAESLNPYVFGVVVGENCNYPSNWTSTMSFEDFLSLKDIPGISDLDTRQITKLIREKGNLKAKLTDSIENLVEIVKELREAEEDIKQVEKVSIQKAFHIPNDGKKILVIDLGSINDIVKELNKNNMDITVLPYDVTGDYIMSLKPDGVIYSDGPGRPENILDTLSACSSILGRVPVFGIGLGHLLVGAASGFEIERMKFGFGGANYPVRNLLTNKVEIVAKNNLYTIKRTNSSKDDIVIYEDINNKSVDGLLNKEKFCFSIQFQAGMEFEGSINSRYQVFYDLIEAFKGEENA